MGDYRFIRGELTWNGRYDRIKEQDLRCAVDVITSFLSQKIQYYGDRGPLDFNQPTYPKSDAVKTFVEMYTEDLQRTQELINSLVDKVIEIKTNDQREAPNADALKRIEDAVNGINSRLDKNERERNQNAEAEQQRSRALESEIEEIKRDRDQKIAAIEQDRDQKIADIKRDRDQKIAVEQQRSRDLTSEIEKIKRDRDQKIAAVERDRDQKIAAIEQDRDQRIAELQRERDQKITAEQQRSRDLMSEIEEIKRDRDQKIAAVERDRDQKIAAVERERDQKIADEQQRRRELEQKFNQLEQKFNQLEAANEAWNDLVRIYRPVLESMQQCPTFKSMLEENQIGTQAITPGNLFGIATLIGNSVDFAKEVHNYALKVKQTTNEPITPAEIEVYKALNDCYRRLWNIDFDVFIMPGGKSVSEPFVKIPFNKNEVVYMKNPREKTSKYTQAVYVPILKAQNGNIHTLAQVQAGNM